MKPSCYDGAWILSLRATAINKVSTRTGHSAAKDVTLACGLMLAVLRVRREAARAAGR